MSSATIKNLNLINKLHVLQQYLKARRLKVGFAQFDLNLKSCQHPTIVGMEVFFFHKTKTRGSLKWYNETTCTPAMCCQLVRHNRHAGHSLRVLAPPCPAILPPLVTWYTNFFVHGSLSCTKMNNGSNHHAVGNFNPVTQSTFECTSASLLSLGG